MIVWVIGLKIFIERKIITMTGICFESRVWSNIITNILIESTKDKILIKGKDYPEAYKNFSVDFFIISTKGSDNFYDELLSGYKNGNYIVYLRIPNQYSFGKKTILNHELKHAYEDWQRQKKGFPGLRDTKESLEIYTKDFEKLLKNGYGHIRPFYDVFKAYYWTFNVEGSALIENVYDDTVNYENELISITKRDFTFPDVSLKRKQSSWNVLVANANIPLLKKFQTPQQFLDKSNIVLKKKANKILRRVRKMKFVYKDIE